MHMHETMKPADVYENQFVPALFQQWGPVVAEAAGVRAGDRVLDVACGTGVLALAAAGLAGPTGEVIGVDPNEEMLEVARRHQAAVGWRVGAAESLPVSDEHIDAVVSQFGFMFFDDQTRALAEMLRVLRPGGRLALAVFDAIDHSPGYSVLAELLHRRFGQAAADAIRAPFVSGDPEHLCALVSEAGFTDVTISRREGTVRFPSPRSLISTERACVWTLGGMLDDAQFDRLGRDIDETFAPFREHDGTLAFSMPALVVTARKS
jgi:ubiquinone/menaquinone biosynthesis C-methylase UbiE